MKGSADFARMYSLDTQNRAVVLDALEKKILGLFGCGAADSVAENSGDELTDEPPPERVAFLDMLKPMDGSPENSLEFIIEKTEQAEFKFPLFTPVTRLRVNKNPYGFNGCMMAMVDFFYQRNYFKKGFLLEDVFSAYLLHSGNSIGKFRTFLSEFRHNKSYKEHFDKLNSLKIKKLP